jgi:hypothetical protein
MKKYLALCALVACAASPLVAKTKTSSYERYKSDLVSVFRSADQQREAFLAAVHGSSSHLGKDAIAELKKTREELEHYKEIMLEERSNAKQWSPEEKKAFSLIQELIRQLTNAELAYSKKVARRRAYRRYVIPAGTAVSVFGGLMLLSVLVPSFSVTWTRAALCGLAAGAAVALIAHQGAVTDAVGDMSRSVKDFTMNSLTGVGKTVAAIAVAGAAVGAVTYKRSV